MGFIHKNKPLLFEFLIHIYTFLATTEATTHPPPATTTQENIVYFYTFNFL